MIPRHRPREKRQRNARLAWVTPERMLTTAAVLISALSLSFSLWQAQRTIEHNKLTVLPHVDFNRHFHATANEVGLEIVNDGVGPAIVQQFEILLDGQVIPTWEPVIYGHHSLWERTTPVFQTISPGSYLSAGEQFFVFSTAPTNVRNMSRFQELLRTKAIVRVRYCSVYEDCKVVCSGTAPCLP